AARLFEWADAQLRLPICKLRVGLLHPRMSMMLVKRRNSKRSRAYPFSHIRIDLISLVRDFEGPAPIRCPLQACRTPNLLCRFACRLHLHCRGQLAPRKCFRHRPGDDRELCGWKPVERCIEGAQTQMSCRLLIIPGLCLFTSKGRVL